MTIQGSLEKIGDYQSLLDLVITGEKGTTLQHNLIAGADTVVSAHEGADWKYNLDFDSIYTYHKSENPEFDSALKIFLVSTLLPSDVNHILQKNIFTNEYPTITSNPIIIGMFCNETPGVDDTTFIVIEKDGKYIVYEFSTAEGPIPYGIRKKTFDTLNEYFPLSNYFDEN